MVYYCLHDTDSDLKKLFSHYLPYVGIYIAAATVLCLLLMLWDVFQGIFHRKGWIPCKSFGLSSLTLTFIGVIAKLPTDLTDAMPDANDQLSKLTSTTMICTCMGLFMPSLGTMGRRECYTNMASLSILVIIVIVHVVIQIGTSLIADFLLPEHIIVLFFMLVLLAVLWLSAVEIIHAKEVSSDLHGKIFGNNEVNMLQRLKYCYVYSYISNPQSVLCRTPYAATVGTICSFCSLIVAGAALRSQYTVRFTCDRVCDYKWSVPYIVRTQIVFVLIGGLVTFIRSFTSMFHLNMNSSKDLWDAEVEHLKLQFMFFNWKNTIKVFVRICIILALFGVIITNFVQAFQSWILTQLLRRCRKLCMCICNCNENEDIQDLKREFKLHGVNDVQDWILEKGQKDLMRWIKKHEKNSPDRLIKFLTSHSSDYPPSDQDNYIEQTGKKFIPDYRISTLSVVFLVKIAARRFPDRRSKLLTRTLDEAFKIICFIDEKTSVLKYESKMKRQFAKEVWKGGEFRKNIRGCNADIFSIFRPGETKRWSFVGLVNKEVDITEALIKDHNNVEQILADMLFWFLSKLKICVLKDITESPPEEYERRVKRGIKFFCKLKKVDDYIQWEYPEDVEVRNGTASVVSTSVTENTGDQIKEENIELRVLLS